MIFWHLKSHNTPPFIIDGYIIDQMSENTTPVLYFYFLFNGTFTQEILQKTVSLIRKREHFPWFYMNTLICLQEPPIYTGSIR